MNVADLRRLLHYDRWANRQVAQALANLGSAPSKCVRWIAHIAGAQVHWLARLRRQSPPLPVWPEFAVAASFAQIEAVERAWSEFIGALDDAALESKCEYVNSKGERFASTVADIILHVVLHSAYHRGQIAAEMRAAGFTPEYTDFIHAARQGYID